MQQAWSLTGAIFGAIAITTTLITTFSIKERPELAGEPSKIPPIKAVFTSFKNKPFIILMAAFILSSFSFTVLTALVALLHHLSAEYGRPGFICAPGDVGDDRYYSSSRSN